MGCRPSRPTSVPAVEETRYQITFLLEHEIIGEFGEKVITNPLNSSSDSYKKEMKQNVYIKSIHSSVAKYVQSYGMNVGDIVEKISVEGPDGFEHKVINLDDTTKSLLNSERPITVTCCRKRYNEKLLQYWKWRIRKDTNKNGELDLNNQGITRNDIIIIGKLFQTNNIVKKLWLHNNNITDVRSIGEGLKSNNTLEVLRLDDNNITDDSGIQSIIDVLKTNNTLWYLWLSNNQLSDNMESQLKAIQQYKRDGSNGYQQVERMWLRS